MSHPERGLSDGQVFKSVAKKAEADISLLWAGLCSALELCVQETV